MKILQKIAAAVCAVAITATMTSPISIGDNSAGAEEVQLASNTAETVDSSAALATEEKPMSGKCGDNLTWTLDDEGTLTISGTGDMYDYEYSNPSPWNSSTVVSVTINNGVTSIGSYAFGDNCKDVFVPKSLKRIGKMAFGRSGYSFTENGYRYTDIYYSGSEDEWNNISKPEDSYGDETLLLSICHFIDIPKIACQNQKDMI